MNPASAVFFEEDGQKKTAVGYPPSAEKAAQPEAAVCLYVSHTVGAEEGT
jgi:hypothetical protein